ncbi:hypothetical protein XfCFBP8082_06325 [Xylella fastidiosa subsp. fastidiosa]|jgi:hypothetical protein|uniref:Uncharacterized protein n=1 Tax=Xylella fastidiosa (strain M23) TaxID=405441 RepID=B2I7G9_XYLF2|nr:hypothetical protein [Xylella fastidiosa]ACB93066.1 hypothetical protein XfasM23_1659 [Xylella fastidiosa M23]EGO82210.1 hypothetical protein XFEB_00953 [Xylella fastidiosa EB92.1]KAF0571975.1 hypothetical protein P305_02225 [Xylella fastidiosa subsp. fastidiosa Mus-1]KGM20281.1 hypothetical protein JT24_08695 [Xylella fastidiosa]NBI39328.1 hypothetical protein [Xylella fastidiosa subsp. fastidiosa]
MLLVECWRGWRHCSVVVALRFQWGKGMFPVLRPLLSVFFSVMPALSRCRVFPMSTLLLVYWEQVVQICDVDLCLAISSDGGVSKVHVF